MAARRQPLPEPEELQELQVRVVRLSELGGKLARPASGDAAQTVPAQTPRAHTAPTRTAPAQTVPAHTAPAHTAPAHTAPARTAPAQTAPAPAQTARARPAPHPARPSPQPPPAAAKRTAAPAVALPAEPEPQRRLLSSGRLFFVLVTVLLYLGWSTQTERYISPNRGVGYGLALAGGSPVVG